MSFDDSSSNFNAISDLVSVGQSLASVSFENNPQTSPDTQNNYKQIEDDQYMMHSSFSQLSEQTDDDLPDQNIGNQSQNRTYQDRHPHSYQVQDEFDSEFSEENMEVAADDALALQLFDLISHSDIWDLSAAQSQVLEHTRKAQWSLLDFNSTSLKDLTELQSEYENHVKMIQEMKKDLDQIFKKSRNIKAKLYAKFPQAKFHAMQVMQELESQNQN